MKPRPFALGKIFSKESYGRSFLNGEIYISQLATFGIGKLLKGEEVLDKHRDDFNEGLRVNLHTSDNMPLEQVVTFFSDIGGIPKDANAIGEIDSRFISENISCYTALFFDSNAGEYMKPNAELTKFQDADDGNKGIAIIIHDVSELLKRVFTVLSSALGSQYWAAYGLVDYSFSSSMIDTLFQADAELRARVVRQVVQDGTIPHLKERLDKLREEVPDGEEHSTAAA